ncbi:pickpocket protein 28-like [Tenebrio molitor]|uniref:pickpocket protein 28-like n=1 Tax=Tenebrio molitor TaxID=7067 RepID=UPI003624ABED
MTLYLDDRRDIGNKTVAKMDPACEKELYHNVEKYVREYNEVTGIHGLRYLTEKRSKTEKIFWVIILLLSLVGCIYMIYEVLYKYNNSPVVVSFATEDTPLHEIPFPAITLCPEFKYSRQKFNFSEVYYKIQENETVDDEDMRNYEYLGLLCDETMEGNKTIDNRFFEAIDELKPIGDDILPICVYMDRVLPCKELLTPIFVDQGICYSFNILGRDEIFRKHVYHYADYYDIRNKSRQDFDIETGYEEGAGINTYPRRALTSGADNALSIFFEYDTEETDFVCNNFHQGFRVLIHNPWEVPRLSKHYFRIPFDKVVIAAMSPEMVTTSREVRRFKPETRKCYMADERPLKHFQKYTQSNCLLECLTNYTLNECGCVWFFMPRDSDTAVCGVGSAECMDKTEVKIKVKKLEYKIMGKSFCDCKPSCTQLKFNVETSDGDFYFKEYFKTVHQKYFKNNTSHWSVLDIYFKEEQFMTKERHQLYGTSDLISNLGGLLGLFTGFSLISLAEIIYFLSLRIFCNDRMYGLWSGPPN